MLAIPDPWNLSERLRDKGLKMNLLHNCCRELLSTVINCCCIHLWQEKQQKENISLNLELYLFMYALWCYSTIIIWHIGSGLVLCLVVWAMCYELCAIGWSATKMHKTFILWDSFRVIIDASQFSPWHSQNPAREVGSSAWHRAWGSCTAPQNADVSPGQTGENPEFPVSSPWGAALVFLSVAGRSGGYKPGWATFQFAAQRWHRSTGSRSPSVPGWRIIAAAIEHVSQEEARGKRKVELWS